MDVSLLPRLDTSPEHDEEGGVLTVERPDEPGSTGSNYRVILYNDNTHSIDEVVMQLMKATGCEVEEAAHITIEAHLKGRAVCFKGEREKCHKVARVLREIRLQCEVDCD